VEFLPVVLALARLHSGSGRSSLASGAQDGAAAGRNAYQDVIERPERFGTVPAREEENIYRSGGRRVDALSEGHPR